MQEIASEDEVDEISRIRLGEADSLEISSGDLSKIRSKLKRINDDKRAAGSDVKSALEDCITASTMSMDKLGNYGPEGPAGQPSVQKPDTVLTIGDSPSGALSVNITGQNLHLLLSNAPAEPRSRLHRRLSVAKEVAFAVTQLIVLILLGVLILTVTRAIIARRL